MFKDYKDIEISLAGLTREEAYKELLSTTEWRNFRNITLHRDNYRCRSCNNNDGYFVPERIELTESDIVSRKKAIQRWVDMFLNIRRYELRLENRHFDELMERSSLYVKAEFSHANYKYERIVLQIHHTYYIFENLPWQYPQECMQSLCLSCHRAVHEKDHIPVYFDNSLSSIYGYRGNCGRCGGTGYLSEYKHVQAGICFECGGSGGVIKKV